MIPEVVERNSLKSWILWDIGADDAVDQIATNRMLSEDDKKKQTLNSTWTNAQQESVQSLAKTRYLQKGSRSINRDRRRLQECRCK